MTDLRTAAQQALECLKGVARGKYDGNAAEVCAALEAALAQQAEPVDTNCHTQGICQRSGYGITQQAEPVEPVAWLRVIDEAMVTHHLGVADPADDYETAKRKMNNLLCTAQDIGTFFAKTEPVQEPFGYLWPTGGHPEFRFTQQRRDGVDGTPVYTTPPQQAEPVEPVAQVHPNHLKPTDDGKPWCREVLLYSGDHNGDLFKGENYRVKLYTAPPQRKPLTEKKAAALIELDPRMLKEFGIAPSGAAMELIRRTERAHGIGEKK